MSEARPGKTPATFGEAIQEMALSPEDEAILEAKKGEAADAGFSSVEDHEAAKKKAEEAAEKSPLAAAAANPGSPTEIPPWVILPPSFRFPVGRTVGFVRFLSDWTTRPDKGVLAAEDDQFPAFRGKRFRQAILWSLSISDEKFARHDARGDGLALIGEMAKRTIRAIDGNTVDWSTGAVNLEKAVGVSGQSYATGKERHVPTFWEEIGPACRQLIVAHYHKTHTLQTEDLSSFFMHCYAVRTAVPG